MDPPCIEMLAEHSTAMTEIEAEVASMSPRSAVASLQTEVSSLRDMLESERASSAGVLSDMESRHQHVF